ncbi:uncharacterized protein [Ptychodera flava]|uniref:uncharacterized protein n=1 Tax=Ptychodera flava TaxID=63121 RepID=UPI003969DE7B
MLTRQVYLCAFGVLVCPQIYGLGYKLKDVVLGPRCSPGFEMSGLCKGVRTTATNDVGPIDKSIQYSTMEKEITNLIGDALLWSVCTSESQMGHSCRKLLNLEADFRTKSTTIEKRRCIPGMELSQFCKGSASSYGWANYPSIRRFASPRYERRKYLQGRDRFKKSDYMVLRNAIYETLGS